MTEPEFQEAYQSHKDVVYRFIRRMTGSRAVAEDLAQECFLRLWRKSAAWDQQRGTLRSLLLGVARNLTLEHLRRQRPQVELGEESVVIPPVDLAGLERAEAVARAVAALPAVQREVLILAEYEESSLEEICIATGAGLAAVKSRLHRARENARRMLEPLLDDARTNTRIYGTPK